MPPGDPGSTDLSPLRLLRDAVRRRRLIVRIPAVLILIVLSVSLLLPRKYTAWAAFTPESEVNQLSSLAGVAAEFGVNLPSSDNTQSPDFYTDLVTRPTFLVELAASPYAVHTGAGMLTFRLDSVLDIHEATAPATLARTAEALGRLLFAKVSGASGIVEVSVTLPSSELSLAVIERTLNQIQRFNVDTRQSRARWERTFIEERLKSATDELGAAEDRLGTFLQRNRDYRNSPQLQFEADRLQRAVALRQDVLTTLARSLEQAKIDEVKASPVLTIVEPPTVNPYPDRRHLALKGLLAGIVGLVLALLVAVVGEYYEVVAGADAATAGELSAIFSEMRREIAESANWMTVAWQRWRGRLG